MEYSLSDLARITGAKRRALQLWAEAGAILTQDGDIHGGRGTHRRYSRDEAIIACLLAPLSRVHQMPIGGLVEVGARVRGILSVPAHRAHIETAMSTGSRLALVISTWDQDNDIVLVRHEPSEPLSRFHEDLGLAADTFADEAGVVIIVLPVGTYTRKL
jgi:hypothetical protein